MRTNVVVGGLGFAFAIIVATSAAQPGKELPKTKVVTRQVTVHIDGMT